MTVCTRVVGGVAGFLFLLAFARPSAAANQEALLQQITSLNKVAIAAYSDGDFDKSKSQLLQAVTVSKKDSDLQTHPMMARTFLHLGVLYVDGFEDRGAGVRYFVKALKIRPDIEVAQAMATKTVKSAFEDARKEAEGTSGDEPTATAETTKSKDRDKAAAKEKEAEKESVASADEESEEEPAPKLTAAEKRKAAAEAKRAEAEEKKNAAAEAKRMAAEEKRAAAEEKKNAAAEAKRAAADEKRAAAEAKEKDRQARDESEKLMKELAQVQGSEAKERAAKEKLQTEKAALERLQKESKDKEKELQATQDKLTKELAQLKDSEAKERAAKEKLQAEKAEKEKQLADAKGSIQQLQKEKADKEKQLADGAVREKKEREAKEKLDKEKQLADTREKERKTQEETKRVERQKLAEGPTMPSRLPEPLHCALPDEAQAGNELFVHCAPRPELKAKVVALYYRHSGGVHYNSVAMDTNKKGWNVAVIPADHVNGKNLQYYAEARDGAGKVVAATGRAASPSILSLRSGSGGPPTTTAGRTKPKSR